MRKYFFLIILIIANFLFLVYQGIYWPKEPSSKKEISFNIKKGEGTKEIARNLKRESLIKSGSLFRFYTLFKGVSGKLQAGEYLLSPSMTVPEIARKIVSGDVVKEKITIVEGWNLKEIAQYLGGKGFLEEEFFELTKKDFSQDYDFLKDYNPPTTLPPSAGPSPKNLEGYLFPDTYEIKKGETLESIIDKMLQNFDKKLTKDLREEISRQEKTIFEIVTMASMIEKEVKTFEDKKLVSGILWKRLKNNIPLQVDATITYITGKKTTEISVEDTKIDSPYNTYKYKGLPLGPISNPGLESILASIYPEDSKYLYYLSTPEGNTIFSKTLEEHNIAKAKYLPR